MPYDLTKEEQETVIRTNAFHKSWDLWTFDPVIIRRLEKKGYEFKKDHQGGWSVQIPFRDVSIHKAKPRNLSPEQRAKMSENAKLLAISRAKSKIKPSDMDRLKPGDSIPIPK